MARVPTDSGAGSRGDILRRIGSLHNVALPSDNMVLTLLWTLVLVGLAVLTFFVAPALFGWSGPKVLVTTAHASETIIDRLDLQRPDRPVAPDPIVNAPLETDVSADLGLELGSVIDSRLHSEILGMDLPYRVYLPPNYYSSQQRYPVVYLLHGNAGDYKEWTEAHYVANFADTLISRGQIDPMLIVMPEGAHSYFMNHAVDGQRWGDYVSQELVPFVDSHYRTLPDREHRAIGGHSMGGHGALQLAFNNPDLFSAVAANSPALRTDMEDSPYYFGDPEYYARYDPIRLAETMDQLDSLQIWMDIGDEDTYFPATEQLHQELAERGIDHEWHPYTGVHYTTYWIEHTPDYLQFYSGAFARANANPTLAGQQPKGHL